MATDPASIIAFIVTVAKSAAVRKIVTTVLIAAASQALRPKKKSGALDRTTTLTKRRDSAPVREAILGTGVTAGQFIDAVAHGPDNMFYTENVKLADHLCDGLVAVVSGGRQLTVDPVTGVVAEYMEGATPRMWIHFRSGAWDQNAHPAITTAFGSVYSAADRGRGICDVTIVCDMRSEALFPGRSPPELRFVVRGARLYNPALDVSRGGTHVWGDPATYAWSDNAAVILYNLLRGLWIHGPESGPYRLYGGQAEAEELPLASWAAEVIACDMPVPLKAGGTEPRWRAGLVVSCAQDLDQTLEDVLSACAGILIETGGVYQLRVGSARTPVATITDKSFVEGTLTRALHAKARSRFNRVTARFVDPSALWQPGALPDRTSASALAADLGEVRIEAREFGAVQSATQGQRLMKLLLMQFRGLTPATLGVRSSFQGQLVPELAGIEAGDWVTWQSARRGWTKTFQVLPVDLRTEADQMMVSAVTLVEVSALDHVWDPETDELDPTAPATIPPPSVPAASLTGFSALPAAAVGPDDSSPGIRVLWNAPTDPTITEVTVEYRRGGAVIWERQTAAALAGAVHLTGLSGGTWQVRATPVPRPARPATTTGAVEVTLTGASIGIGAGASALVDPGFGRQTDTQVWQTLNFVAATHDRVATAPGLQAWRITFTGTPAAGSLAGFFGGPQNRLTVRPDDKVQVSADVGGVGLSGIFVQVLWFNAAGTAFDSAGVFASGLPAGDGALSTYRTVGGLFVAPAGTASAAFNVYAAADGVTASPVARTTRPMLALARPEQTQLAPWAPGFRGQPGADVTGSNVAAAVIGQGPLATTTLTPAQVQGRFLGSFATEAAALAAGLVDGDTWLNTTDGRLYGRSGGESATVAAPPTDVAVGKISRSTDATGIDSASYTTVLGATITGGPTGIAQILLTYQPGSVSGSSTSFQYRLTRAGVMVAEGAPFLGIDGAGDPTVELGTAAADLQGFYNAASGTAVWALQIRRTSGTGRINTASGEIVVNQQPS